ncbi:MAG: GxxExxY protein [Rhodospirillales bacterium]|nr:GxxExxY protein [Rhodospirillales bacterium]MCB9995655.1 GxxExxY protein [Rhodospirillales bacterium]
MNTISGFIVDSAVNVHKNLGPGLLESIYEEALCYELEKRRVCFERQKVIQVSYEDITLKTNFRLDLLVENKIVVELKCSEKVIPLYQAQLLTYLKITKCKLGLLLNFNAPLMKEGIHRIVL